jgi:hypothetical protein
MLPFMIPIHFYPPLQKRNVLKYEINVNLISALCWKDSNLVTAPDQDMQWCLVIDGVQVFPNIVETEVLGRCLGYIHIEAVA